MRRGAALVAAYLVLSRGARAEPPSADVDARYATIDAALAEGEGRARLWWYGWTLGFSGLTLGEGTVALVTRDPGTRVDAVVSAAGSVLGAGAMLLATSRAAFEARARLAAMDASTPAARLARLREAERLLDAIADDEAGGRSVLAHLASDAVTLAGTFVLWAGYHRYASGWLNLVGGTIVGEAQILTRPTAGIDARRAYRAGVARPPPPAISWTVAPIVGGLLVGATF